MGIFDGIVQALRDIDVDEALINEVVKALETSAEDYQASELTEVLGRSLGSSAAAAEFTRNAVLAREVVNDDLVRGRHGLHDGGQSVRQYQQDMNRVDEQSEEAFLTAMGRLQGAAGDDSVTAEGDQS